MMPAGIVATMISQAIFSGTVCTLRWRTELTKPPMIRTQSRQKNISSASAVATCRPTMNARYGDSLACSWLTKRCHEPPIRAGTSTEWPRLDTGKSSVTPCRTPIVIACKKFRCGLSVGTGTGPSQVGVGKGQDTGLATGAT